MSSLYPGLEGVPSTDRRVRIAKAKLLLEAAEMSLQEVRSILPAMAVQPEQVAFLIDVDPREIINAFFALSAKIVADFTAIINGPDVALLSDEVLAEFVNADSIVSTTPDLYHPDALKGVAGIPSLQTNPDLKVKTALILFRFLNFEKIARAVALRSNGSVSEDTLKLSINELLETMRLNAEEYHRYYERLVEQGVPNSAMPVIMNSLLQYVQGIKDLSDAWALPTTGDLYSNILVIVATIVQLAEILSTVDSDAFGSSNWVGNDSEDPGWGIES